MRINNKGLRVFSKGEKVQFYRGKRLYRGTVKRVQNFGYMVRTDDAGDFAVMQHEAARVAR